MAASYTCSLTEASKVKAKEELNESPEERLGAVETLRTWIQQQPHLKCPTDTAYLLRFLRFAHFSQLEARKGLTKFFTRKTKEPQWLSNIDSEDKKIQAALNLGMIIPLPGFTDDGRKILMLRPGNLDPSSKLYEKKHVVQMFFLVLLHLLEDENIQVNGIEILYDFTGLNPKIPAYFGMDNMKKFISIFQGAVPIRQKVFHHYNAGPVFEAIFAIIKTVIPKKLQDRIVSHGSNLENVYKQLPMHLLPKDYLPDDYVGPSPGTITEIKAKFIEEVSRPVVREQILAETKAEWGVDESKIPTDNIPQASFRKLNID